MKTYIQFINESVYKDQFLYLYNLAPESLQKEIDDTKNVLQSVEWHPEGPTFVHIRLVTNRLENCYHDINLTLAGLFHDLGKTYVTKPNGRGGWSAHGHEDESVKIVEQYQDWITKMGGDVDIVKYVVANHMRYKVIDEMRTQEQIRFMDEEYFPYVQKFATADFGGTDLNCKEINNQEEIKEKLKEFKKREEDNKIINSKFNGRMVMDKYPELKGKSLGDALTKFKSSFDDFNEYVFNNPSDKIMKRFDDFISSKVVSSNFVTNESIRDKMIPKSEDEILKKLEGLSDSDKIKTIISNKLNYDLLPNNLTIYETFYCSWKELIVLPDNLTINGSLSCSHNKLTSLPNNLIVNGNLYCNSNKLTSLPNNLIVNGDLDCSDNELISLPDNLTVKGDLICINNMLTKLPNNLTVGGSLICHGNRHELKLKRSTKIKGKFIN
jgi:hypothetical protein